MTKTFLTQKFAPSDMDKRRTLGLKLNRISEENAIGLLNDLCWMSADEMWSFVSKMDEAIHVPVLNRLAVKSLPEETGLRYDTTLRMIGLILKDCSTANQSDLAEVTAGVSKLIRGYRHRTNLNLLKGLGSELDSQAKELLAGKEEIDLACAEHLERALLKPSSVYDLDKMVRVIGDLQLERSLLTLAKHLKRNLAESYLGVVISDLYFQDRLTPPLIGSIMTVFGDHALISHTQKSLGEGQGKRSMEYMVQVLSEDRIVTDVFLDQAMAATKGDISKSKFLSGFTHGKSVSFEYWPKTMDFIYKNLSALTADSSSIFQPMFIKHSIDHGHAHLVVETCISRLKTYMIKADQELERTDYGTFDYGNTTQADILNRTFDKFYEANWRAAELKKWRWSVMDIIQEAGILQFSEMAENANSRLRAEMIEAIGEPENKAEILQKLVKFRGGWFTQELGV